MIQILKCRQLCAWTGLFATAYLFVQYALVWLVASAWLLLDLNVSQTKTFPWMLLIDAVHVLVAMLLCLVPLLKYAGWLLVDYDTRSVPAMPAGLRWMKGYWPSIWGVSRLLKDVFGQPHKDLLAGYESLGQ